MAGPLQPVDHRRDRAGREAALLGQAAGRHRPQPRQDVHANFKNDFLSLRRFAERDYPNILSWNVYDSGGHYGAHQEPELFVQDVRGFFRRVR
ncbi:MAG TPA: hypothetical protein VFZ75_11900 [Actinomycetota bacterium]|nr:hypothetical protein [Actinomycetota bacterium]